MGAAPGPDAPRCAHCGCFLATDDHAPVCSPCRRTYRRRRLAGYRPQHDPDLRGKLLATLQQHEGERINVYQTLGMWPAGPAEWVTVKARIRVLVCHGHGIRGFHDGTYLYVSDSGSAPTSASD